MTIEEAITSQDFGSPATPESIIARLQHENHRLSHLVTALKVDLELSEKRRYRHIKRFLLKRRQYRVALQNIMAAEQTVKWMRRAEYLMRHLQRLKQIKDVTQRWPRLFDITSRTARLVPRTTLSSARGIKNGHAHECQPAERLA